MAEWGTMSINPQHTASADDVPQLMALITQVLLERLAGQTVITFEEIRSAKKEFAGLRIFRNVDTEELVITLQSRAPVNDRASTFP